MVHLHIRDEFGVFVMLALLGLEVFSLLFLVPDLIRLAIAYQKKYWDLAYLHGFLQISPRLRLI